MTFKSRTKFADLAARLSDAIPSRTRLRPFKILFRSNSSAPRIGTACAYRVAAQNLAISQLEIKAVKIIRFAQELF